MAQRRQRGLLDPDAKRGESPSTTTSTCWPRTGTSWRASRTRRPRSPDTTGWTISPSSTTRTTSRSRTTPRLLRGRRQRGRGHGWMSARSTGAPPGPARGMSRISTRSSPRSPPARPPHKPSLVILRTVIAWPAPTEQDTGKSHGSALGADEVAAVKTLPGWTRARTSTSTRRAQPRAQVVKRGRAAHTEWTKTRGMAYRQPGKGAAARPAGRGTAARRLSRPSRASRPTPGASRPGPPGKVLTALARSCPSCGAARPTSPSRTTRR